MNDKEPANMADAGNEPKRPSVNDQLNLQASLQAEGKRLAAEQAAKPKRKRKPRVSNSRPARWARAVADAQAALSAIKDAIEEKQGELEVALEALGEIRQEYEDWKDNLGDAFSGSPLVEKLEAVCELDFEFDADGLTSGLDEIEGKLDEAEGIDLPLGFGRD